VKIERTVAVNESAGMKRSIPERFRSGGKP